MSVPPFFCPQHRAGHREATDGPKVIEEVRMRGRHCHSRSRPEAGLQQSLPEARLEAGASFIHYCYLYCVWYLQKTAAAHTLITPALPWERGACQDSRWTAAWSPFMHPPELTAWPGALAPPPGTKDQPGPPSLLPEQLRLTCVPRRTFQQLKWLEGSEESMKGDKQAGV